MKRIITLCSVAACRVIVSVLALVSVVVIVPANAQQAYFADGYHGGVYGHYPLDWYTQFLVDQLEQHPQWCIGLEIEPETWDSVRVHTPEAYQQFRHMVETSHRIEITNPSYAQSYLYPIAGESIIRQFQYGMRKLREHFPTAAFTTYAVEEPCFTSQLPQILTQLGFRHAVLKCPDTCWGGYTEPFGGELVNWIGPDGTSMLSVPRYACEALQENSVWQTIAWKNSPQYLRACRQAGIQNPIGMCYQDAGWKYGPWLGRHNSSKYVLWTDYIEQIADKSSATDYHMTQEGVQVALVWGSQVMQRIAQQVRRAENRLLDAERIAAMANIETGFRPDQALLDEAWRQLMLAQHHDSWIVPYNRLNKRGTWADNIALWTADACRLADNANENAHLSPLNPSSNSWYQLSILNTTGKQRHEVVTFIDEQGQERDVMVDAPAFGWVSINGNDNANVNDNGNYPLHPERSHPERSSPPRSLPSNLSPLTSKYTSHLSEAFHPSSENTFILDNDAYRLEFDLSRGGVIKSLFDKQQRHETVNKKGEFAFGELRGYFERDGRYRSSTESKATATVVKDNELVQSIQIKGQIAGVPFCQTYTLKKGTPLIDVELSINWTALPADELEHLNIGDHKHRSKEDKSAPFYNTKKMLNIYFPVRLHQPKLWKNAPFDVCESRLDSTFFDRWTDIQHNIIHSWVDLYDKKASRGFALFTDHTTSYSFAADHPLALTVQYSGMGLWGRNHKITEDTRLHYAILPHQGRWDEAGISDRNEEWNHPLILKPHPSGGKNETSLLSLDGTGYQLSAMLVDENGDLLMRLFNADGDNTPHNIKLGFPVSSIEEIDLRGERIVLDAPANLSSLILHPSSENAPLTSNQLLQVQMPRFGIRTYRIKKK